MRKFSEAGRTAERLISGLGSGATLGFRHLHDGVGRDGESASNEALRLLSPLSGELFLDRKRFMVTAALVVYCNSVADRQWCRPSIRSYSVSVAD